jgi:predicted amidohydrolase
MRVAVVTNRNRPGYPDENVRDHLRWMRRAAAKRARLVLFPELSLPGYSTRPFMRRMGMALDAPPCRKLCSAARELDLFVAFGLALKRGRQLSISHVIAGPQGIVGHYEKVHLAGGPTGEAAVFSPGEAFRVFDVDGVAVGVNICFDGRHPASSLCVAHMGAEVILHPHGNTVGMLGRDPAEWARNKRAYLGPRSFDTCSYTLVCNSVGRPVDRDGVRRAFCGGALVLGPDGQFVAHSKTTALRAHMIVADLDILDLRNRRPGSSLACRRPEVYVKALLQSSRLRWPPGEPDRPGEPCPPTGTPRRRRE